jgi:hypothetical protein
VARHSAQNPKQEGGRLQIVGWGHSRFIGTPAHQSFPPAAAERLSEIKAPTLLILGDRDVSQIKATIETLEKGIRGSRKVVIKNAGHMVNVKRPAEFNDAVMAFWRKQRVRFSECRRILRGGVLVSERLRPFSLLFAFPVTRPSSRFVQKRPSVRLDRTRFS